LFKKSNDEIMKIVLTSLIFVLFVPSALFAEVFIK